MTVRGLAGEPHRFGGAFSVLPRRRHQESTFVRTSGPLDFRLLQHNRRKADPPIIVTRRLTFGNSGYLGHSYRHVLWVELKSIHTQTL
jgi:hypothetical protein